MEKKGFTLIELLAVIVILAILALIVSPIISGAITNAKLSSAARSLEGYAQAIELAEIKYQSANQGSVTKVLSELSIEAKSKNKVTINSIVIEDSGIVSSIIATVDGYTCTYNKDSGAVCNNGTKTIPWVLTEDNDNNGILSTGDLITLNTESFYVISNDGTTIRALAKYNLLVGNEYDGTNLTPVTGDNVGLQDESAKGWNIDLASVIDKWIGVTPFSATNYWYNSGLKSEYGTTYPAYVYDNNSTLYQYLEAYKTALEGMNSEDLTVDLIKKEELDSLGCEEEYIVCDTPTYSWTHSTSYWTGSVNEDQYVWFVNSVGDFSRDYFSNDDCFGVRPVVNIPASQFK